MNRDGSVDLLVTLADWRTRTAVLQTYTGRGDGTFTLGVTTPLAQGTNALAVSDLDGDGRLDVLLSMARDGINDLVLQIFFGDGRGGFSRTVNQPVPANIVDHGDADLDHDGRLDVIGVTWELMLVMLGTGDGGLAAATASQSNAYRLAIGDLNEDGHLDAVTNSPLAVSIWERRRHLRTAARARALDVGPCGCRRQSGRRSGHRARWLQRRAARPAQPDEPRTDCRCRARRHAHLPRDVQR